LAGAVRGGDPPVQALGQVQGGVGAVTGPGGEPALVQVPGPLPEQADADVDPRLPHDVAAAAGAGGAVRGGVDHAADAAARDGLGAGAGAAGVAARFQGA